MQAEQVPIPALLATGAVHHHLIRTGEAGTARRQQQQQHQQVQQRFGSKHASSAAGSDLLRLSTIAAVLIKHAAVAHAPQSLARVAL